MSRSTYLITYLLCIYLILSPFILLNGFLSPYELPKFVTTLITAQIIAVLLLFNFSKLKFDLLTKIILGYLLIVFMANILGLDPKTSLIGSVWRYQGFLLLLSGFIFYLASKYSINKKYIEASIIITGFILSAITILEYILISYGYHFPTINNRLVATMGNPNFLAGYILLTLPFILYSNIISKYKIAIIIFCLIAIILTESRSGILALIFLFSIYFYQKIYNKRVRIYLVIALAFIGAAFLFKILFTMYVTSPTNYKLDDYQRRSFCLYHLPENKNPWRTIRLFYETNPKLLKRSSLCESRIIIWNEGYKAFVKRPITGYGQENFELIFPKKLRFNVDNSHNLFLETLISSGIIGLLVFISILFLGFRKSLIKYKLFLILFLIIAFFNPLFISGIILFWITLGLSNNEI